MLSHLILNSALLVVFGLLPSLIWLSFFLKKDCHPEPKYLISKTFLMGIIISPLAIFLQLILIKAGLNTGINFLLWAALIEELLKFYAIKFIVLNNPNFDEPVDAMIYMITAAMGFAAIENILFMFKVVPDASLMPLMQIDPDQLRSAFGILVLRFAGATILHALSSAIIGYFLAMSWFFQQHKSKLLIIGIIIATIFHFTFNVLLSTFSENPQLGIMFSTALLVIMSFLVYILFDKMRERHIKTAIKTA